MLRVPSVVTLHLQSLKCLSLKCMYPVKQWFCVVNPFLKTAFSRAPVLTSKSDIWNSLRCYVNKIFKYIYIITYIKADLHKL